jgi:transcriptional regulator with XRE-family HTH domain
MTQKTFAATLGVTANTVARWERGEVPIPAWAVIAVTQVKEIRRLNRLILALNEYRRLKQRNEQLEKQLVERLEDYAPQSYRPN